ncbi:MAG: hypothetical protein OSJ70_04845 [Bacilli bacterium]|nr:hypothetical protein [Bacilli bacterium]
MKIIAYIIFAFIFYFLGFLVAKVNAPKQVVRLKQETIKSKIRVTNIKNIIRTYRNDLLGKETWLRQLHEEGKDVSLVKYIEAEAQVKLIRKIEEEISNEM